MTLTVWHVFPWDPAAGPDRHLSPSDLPKQSGLDPFDLPRDVGASSWYFAEDSDHAAGEKVQELRNRTVTRDIAQALHAVRSVAGFRWWSTFVGEWHTIVLFSDRLSRGALRFSTPVPLTLQTSALVRAADALGIRLG